MRSLGGSSQERGKKTDGTEGGNRTKWGVEQSVGERVPINFCWKEEEGGLF